MVLPESANGHPAMATHRYLFNGRSGFNHRLCGKGYRVILARALRRSPRGPSQDHMTARFDRVSVIKTNGTVERVS